MPQILFSENRTYRVKGKIYSFMAGSPIIMPDDVYTVLAEDATFKAEAKNGIAKILPQKTAEKPAEEKPADKTPSK